MKFSDIALLGLGALFFLPRLGIGSKQPTVLTSPRQDTGTAVTPSASVEQVKELIAKTPVSEPIPILPAVPAVPATKSALRIQMEGYAAAYGGTVGRPSGGTCTTQKIAPGIQMARCSNGVFIFNG